MDASAPPSRPNARPLLVAPLDGMRVAVLLDDEAPPRPTGTPELLARTPILSAAVTLTRDHLSETARERLAESYELGSVVATDTQRCHGRVEGVVDLARAVADDPAHGDPGGTAAEAAQKTFTGGIHVTAAILVLDRVCDARWAMAGGAGAAPKALYISPADAKLRARLQTWMAANDEPYRALPRGKEWKQRFDVTRVGDDRAWIIAVHWQPGSPQMTCVLAETSDPPKVLARTESCPETLAGVITWKGAPYLWFEHALGRIEGPDVELAYFPAAATGFYGGI